MVLKDERRRGLEVNVIPVLNTYIWLLNHTDAMQAQNLLAVTKPDRY